MTSGRETLREQMPCGDWLARDLGIGRNIIDTALLQLERDGLLLPRGTGRRRRIVMLVLPEHVSLINTDPAPYFDLLDPPVSHIARTFDTVPRTLDRWLQQIASGKDDRKQTYYQARRRLGDHGFVWEDDPVLMARQPPP